MDRHEQPEPFPALRLRPSRAFGALLALLAVIGVAAACFSHLDLPLRASACVAALALLWRAWQRERDAGLAAITPVADQAGQLLLSFRDGTRRRGGCAGHALLGTLAIVLHVEREGWLRRLGPRRYTVLRDATDADSFRRLRAWVRLAL